MTKGTLSMSMSILVLILALIPAQCVVGQNIIISQYVEGSSYNKALVIKNTDAEATFNLGQMKLAVAFNGGEWQDFYQGNNSEGLLAGSTFTLCNPQASDLLLPHCNVLTGSLNFNGNDAIRLLTKEDESWLVADEIGAIDTLASAKGWTVGNTPEATYDHTILRKSNISSGSTWNASEWNVLSKDTLYLNYMLLCLAELCEESPSESESEQGDSPQANSHSKTCDHATNSAGKINVSSLKIATFNVEWLFDGVDDPKMSPWAPGSDSCPGMKHCGSAKGAQKHIKEVSEIIQELDADILNLAEVEDCEVLSNVKAHVRQKYFSYLTKGTDTYTRQNVALLSKIKPTQPIQRISENYEFPIEGSACNYTGKARNTTVSKNYTTRFKINDFTIAFFGVHFKAIPTDPYSCAKREGQAKIMQASIRDSIARGEEVVVLGDMNDFSDLYKDANDDVPTSKVLNILRDVDDDGQDELVNAMHFLKKSQRYTSWYDRNRDDNDNGGNEHSQIDHILLSRKLSELISSVSVNHSYNPALISDHWPVIVELKFNETQPMEYDKSKKDSSTRYVVVAVGIILVISILLFSTYYMRAKNRAEELVFM